jgi:DNA polymerase-1
MMTPDKDYAQLVEENIFQYKPAYMGKPSEICGVKEIKERWGISDVCQIIDILGLMGDSVDNIPGIPGVGEKTAQKLIQEYGSVENLIANRDKVSGKLGENVRNFSEQALLSKELATININVPIEFNEEALHIDPPNNEMVKALFDELEFRAMADRFFGGSASVASISRVQVKTVQAGLFDTVVVEEEVTVVETVVEEQPMKTIHEVPHEYKMISTPEEREKLVEYLMQFELVSFDTETSSIDPHDCDIVGFSFSVKPGEAFYVNSPGKPEEDRKVLEPFRRLFENEKIAKTGQNIKYDMIVLKNYGIQVKGALFDTMLAHYLLEPDSRHNMDLLSGKYLNYRPIPIEDLLGKKGKGQLNMSQVPAEKICDYAAEDADVTLQLQYALQPMMGDAGVEKLYHEVEAPLITVLADMESTGVKLDVEALQAYSAQLKNEMEEVEAKIYEDAGLKFNINSPAQLGEVLFEYLKLGENAKRTAKSKQYATGEDVLSQLAIKHDIARKILDYRSMQKLKSTYIDALPQLINKRSGRVHTTYNQAVAATGRLSSTDPNLQNIPIRTDRGREIRKAFIPRDENHILLSADYSQIELRLIAEISGDEGMIKAFKEKQDIHTATAAKIYGIALEEVTSEMRRRAKMVNFGIIYGISAFGLSQRLGIPRGEAQQIITNYNKQYPRINEYLHNMIAFAQEKGYVETLLGRRRYLRDINSRNATQRGYAERNAINAPIQGTAADMIKVAMINIHNEFEKRRLKSKMILQVHDELVFDALKEELDEIKGIVHDRMVNALKVDIPIEVEMGTGNNWLEAH